MDKKVTMRDSKLDRWYSFSIRISFLFQITILITLTYYVFGEDTIIGELQKLEEQEIKQLQNKLSSRKISIKPVQFSVLEIQKNLPQEICVLKYRVTDDLIKIWIICSELIKSIDIKVKKEEIINLLQSLEKQITEMYQVKNPQNRAIKFDISNT
jgi:hypothetical protein